MAKPINIKMKNNSIFIMIMLFGLFASCNSAKSVNQDKSAQGETVSIFDKTWKLGKINDQAVKYDHQNKKWPSLKLNKDDKRVSGSGGCNNFMGGFTLGENNRLQFSQMASTRMACPNIDFNENDYLKVLGTVKSYELEDNELLLKDGSGKTVLTYSYTPQDSEITEKYWKLKTLNGETVKMDANQEKEVHFILKNEENRVQGFSGCNNFTGSYTLKDNAEIEFTQMIGTLKACPDVDFNEGEFLKIFQEMDHYEIDGDNLAFKDSENKTLATFEAVYF